MLAEEIKLAAGDLRVIEGEETLSSICDSWPRALWWKGPDLAARKPLAVVFPENEDQVCKLLAWGAQRGIPLVPRGAGSGVLGAAIPTAGAVVLDMTRLASRFEIGHDEQGALVSVGAGMMGDHLEEKLNANGHSLMHFPASLAVSTAGGWVATRSFGQLSTRYGGIEKQALAVRAAYPGGEARGEKPGVHLGAEGTLGVITEVTLRLRALPSRWEGTGLDFESMEDALAAARAIWEMPGPKPSVMRLYSPLDALVTGLRRSNAGHGSFPSIRRSLEALALRRYQLINRVGGWVARNWLLILIYEDSPMPVLKSASLGRLPPAQRWWERRYVWDLDRLKDMIVHRGCFADTLDLYARWKDLPAFWREIRAAIAPHAFVMAHCSHFDDEGACLYVTIGGSAGFREKTITLHEAAWRAGMDACIRMGGKPSHHHGVGLGKLPWIKEALSGEEMERLRSAKRELDPKGLMNPGKLCL